MSWSHPRGIGLVHTAWCLALGEEHRHTEPLVMVFATVPNLETGLLSFFRRIGTLPGQVPTHLSKEEIAAIGAGHDFVMRGPIPARG